MGSSGTGRFSDYTGTPGGSSSGGSSGAGGAGGSSCDNAIGDIELEEVGRCDYFRTHAQVPEVNCLVSLKEELVGGRLAIQEDQSGLVLGYLPTRYNYLRACMTDGYVYAGVMTSVVEAEDFPRVWIDLAPQG